jgi:hypothetical protein
MGTEINNGTIEKAYARWAPIYDFVFGALFARARRAAVDAAERVGGRILEVGVGAPVFRCPIMRVPHALSAPTSPNRCCARRVRGFMNWV